MKIPRIQAWLANTNQFWFSTYAILAAFGTYACMYAFRKPISAAQFEDLELWGLGYKAIILISHIVGYTLSKFVGIKFISEMKGDKRAVAILALVGFAELMLLFFGLGSHPWNFFFLFFNGLSLGLIWGIVFSYLEGRRNTELLGAGLSISFVVSSGFVKSVGKGIINDGTSEFWMPFFTGLIFLVPLIFFVLMLDQIPKPSKKDIQMRTKREPMYGRQRIEFFRTFAPGLILLVVVYMFLTAFRVVRDDYAANVFTEAKIDKPEILTLTELPVAFFSLLVMALVMFIKDNFKALVVNHIIIFVGLVMVGTATFLFETGAIDVTAWMILIGLGGYLGYIPFNCIVFDRLIASFKYVSNAGFLIYVADAFGYLATVGLYFYKELGDGASSWTKFIKNTGYGMMIVCSVLMGLSLLYFVRKKRSWKAAPRKAVEG